MGKLKVLICEVDSEDESKLKEIASFDVEGNEADKLEKMTALDELEASTEQIGQAVKRELLQAQWKGIDKELTEAYGERFSPWGSEI